jgi:transposase
MRPMRDVTKPRTLRLVQIAELLGVSKQRARPTRRRLARTRSSRSATVDGHRPRTTHDRLTGRLPEGWWDLEHRVQVAHPSPP